MPQSPSSIVIKSKSDYESLLLTWLATYENLQYYLEFPLEGDPIFDLALHLFSNGQFNLSHLAEKANQELRKLISSADFTVVTEELKQSDWENAWKDHYQPIELGDQLIVVPNWMEVPKSESHRKPIFLDPGMAFGTGQHGTTQGCLLALQNYLVSGQSVLDIGTGSGILSLGAYRLGAAPIYAVDIDPVAIDNAKKQAAINHCSSIEFEVSGIKKFLGAPYDLILANITADTIMANFDAIQSNATKNTIAILSGIIDDRYLDFKAYIESRHTISVLETLKVGDWWTIGVKFQ